jgi:hypothetical protein
MPNAASAVYGAVFAAEVLALVKTQVPKRVRVKKEPTPL